MTTKLLAHLIGWLFIVGIFGVLAPRLGFVVLVVVMLVFIATNDPPLVVTQ